VLEPKSSGSVGSAVFNPMRRAAWWCVAALAAAGWSRAELEWRGMIERNDGPTFALVDTSSGTTKWVPLRGAFLGYVVETYDPQRQLLVLTKEGARAELTLSSGKSAASAPRSGADELRGLSGLPLAEALARRGDPQLKDLLGQHRASVLKLEELSRRLAAAEKAERETVAAPGRAGSAEPTRPAASAPASSVLRKAYEDAEQQTAGLVTEIERVAAQKRDAVGR